MLINKMKIEYNTELKIWKSLNYPHMEYVKHFIGAAFMENFKKVNSEKVIEWNYDTGVTKTIMEIQQDSITVAMNFQRLGIKKCDIIVFYSMANSKISCLTMGALMVGAAVNFFETTFQKDQAKYTLELLSPTVLLYEDKYKATVLEVLNELQLPSLKHTISIDGKTGIVVDNVLLKAISPTTINNFCLPNLGDPQKLTAFLLFTSGSTGLPKAVALSHSQMLHGVKSFWLQPNGSTILTQESIIFSLSPIRWISQVILMLQSLVMGITRVYTSGFPIGKYGQEIVRICKVSHFFSAPSVFKEVILSIKLNDMQALKSLKAIHLGGEDPGHIIIDMALKLAPKATIMRCYGMTELAGITSCDKQINGGFLAPGLELKLLDDNLKSVGPNRNGQLCFRLPIPFLGYHKIDNNKIYYTDGFFNTGDYGFMDDNNALHVLARYKDLVRAKGVILIPSEVEKLVCSHPTIFASILVGYRSLHTDLEDKGALYVVKQSQQQQHHHHHQMEQQDETLKVEIINLLQNHLECNVACIIRLVNIIDKFPLTSCGKVDKPALIQLAKSLDVE